MDRFKVIGGGGVLVMLAHVANSRTSQSPLFEETIHRFPSLTLSRPQWRFLPAASSFQLPSCVRNTKGMMSRIPAAKMRCDKRSRLAAEFAN